MARLVASEIKHYHATHGTATDVNATADSASRSAAPGGRGPHATASGRRHNDGPMHRFEIDIGRRDRANEGAIVRLVCESADIPSAMIGRIAMEDAVSCFEVQKPVAVQVIQGLRTALFDGRPVKVRDAADGGGGGHRDGPRKHSRASSGPRPYPHPGRRGR